MLFIQELQYKSILNLYTQSIQVIIDIDNNISDNDSNLIKAVNSNITSVEFLLHFYNKTQYSIDIVNVNSTTQLDSSTLQMVESTLYKTEYINNLVDELVQSTMYINHDLIRRQLV